MLKAIGIVLIGISLPTVGFLVLMLINIALIETGMGWGWSDASLFGFDSRSWMFYVGYSLQFGLGLYLLIGGKWLLNKIIPSNRPYCPECGYDLSKNTSDHCPECGVALPSQAAISTGSDS